MGPRVLPPGMWYTGDTMRSSSKRCLDRRVHLGGSTDSAHWKAQPPTPAVPLPSPGVNGFRRGAQKDGMVQMQKLGMDYCLLLQAAVDLK